jgi:predicted permease
VRLLRVFRQRARSLFCSARADAELDRELAFHLEQLTRENVEAGMAPAEARRVAHRALGGMAQIAEQCRDERRVRWLSDVGKDIAYGWRMLRKSSGFTAVAALTLALGVGGCIAVYTLAEALLLRSLPYPLPERLVSISSVHVRRGEAGIGQDDFRDWEASNHVFERMTFAEFSQMTLTGQGEPERITGLAVWEGFFETLGVAPRLGRWFTADEQKPRDGDRVIVLSHRLWTRKFGARPNIVGATMTADGLPVRIVGVMPESFRFDGIGGETSLMGSGYVAEYWTPIRYGNHGRRQHLYSCYARLKPRVSVQQARVEFNEIARRLERQFPDNAGWGVRVVSLRSDLLHGLGPALEIFAAAAAIVLLIACANVASLLLARGVGRAKEIAVRMALGAERRVIRLLLVESLLLACLGAAGDWLWHIAC